MHTGQTVFSQLIDFLPEKQFDKRVRRYSGNRRIKTFSCFDQYLYMAFAQITYRQSLRDIETCLHAIQTKLYHCGSPDVIENDINGYVVEPGNPQQMAEALMTILSNSQMQQTMRQNNLLKSKQYDWYQISQEYLKYMI